MLVLGIDTASTGLGVAIAGPDGLIAETTLQTGLRHSSNLLPIVDRTLTTAGYTIGDVEAVAVTMGPGSFTAVRIGLNTAKGICLGRDLPLVGLSTLAAMAARFPSPGGEAMPVIPWLDARRREVYAGYYDTSGSHPRAIEPDVATSPTEWLDGHPGPGLFVGDGAVAYRQQITDRLGAEAVVAPLWAACTSAAACSVWGRELALDGVTTDPDEVAPMYLRRPQAFDSR